MITGFRIGQGWDRHRLQDELPLILGGVAIPSQKGAVAHSDGDVLIHAIIDALLGAAALGDIGTHFPPSNPAYKNIDSQLLLKQVMKLIIKEGFQIVNMDSTIITERPKLAPHISQITLQLSKLLKIEPTALSVKAKTAEKCDAVGREEAIEALAVVLLQKTT